MLTLSHIKSSASQVGFDLCGVARCQEFDTDKAFLDYWLECGYSSTLSYMARNREKRANSALLVEGAKTVIVCGVAYKNEWSMGYSEYCDKKIASYALTTDYHITIKQMLHKMCQLLKAEEPTLNGRCFTDSAPIFEKRYAVEAGLGWIGRQSLLITPQYGSFVLLGVAVIDCECDHYDSPYQGIGCGECRRCIDACPNGAIIERHIDTRRCISCATIERKEESESNTPLHGWIFGCDECQSCCPYNAKAPNVSNPLFAPLFNPTTIEWDKISEADFSVHFAQTPLARAKKLLLRTSRK